MKMKAILLACAMGGGFQAPAAMAGAPQGDGGRFYSPDSGQTYGVKMTLTAPDTLEARFYQGASFLGQTKTLSRIERGTSKGWC